MIRRLARSGLTSAFLLIAAVALSAPSLPDLPIDGAKLIGTLPLDGKLFHVQGLEFDDTHIWVTSVDRRARRGYLHQFDRATGRLQRRIDLTDGPRIHPGGIARSGDALWIPVAEMRPSSSAVLVEIDTRALTVRRRIRVADHIGCLAVDGDNLVAGNWDSRLLYAFDLGSGKRVRIVRNPSPTRFQDMKFDHGMLVGSGYRTWWTGAIDWIDWPTLKLRRSRRAGMINAASPLGIGGSYTREGMAITGRDLYVLPEDGASRLFHFRLSA